MGDSRSPVGKRKKLKELSNKEVNIESLQLLNKYGLLQPNKKQTMLPTFDESRYRKKLTKNDVLISSMMNSLGKMKYKNREVLVKKAK